MLHSEPLSLVFGEREGARWAVTRPSVMVLTQYIKTTQHGYSETAALGRAFPGLN